MCTTWKPNVVRLEAFPRIPKYAQCPRSFHTNIRCCCQAHADTTIGELRTRYPTVGPQHRFANVLLIEKEGFQQIFEHVKLDTRYDLAIMSSKGMNTTAARTLVEKLPGVRFLVLHDFDKAGFSILGTLTRSTRRYHYHRRKERRRGPTLRMTEWLPPSPQAWEAGATLSEELELTLRLRGPFAMLAG